MGQAAGTYRKLRLMDSASMQRAISRMAHELVEQENGTGFALVGIRTRGVPLAQRLAGEIEKSTGDRVSVGVLDITLYRDDLSTVAASPVLKRTDIPFQVEGTSIVLCDDVLFTGRTVRAAIDAVLDFGRPRKVLLAVLVDRGRRELPIEAQYIGKKIGTSGTEIVSVTFRETDGEDDVWLLEREGVPATAKRPGRAAPGGPARKPAAKAAPATRAKGASARAATKARRAAPKRARR